MTFVFRLQHVVSERGSSAVGRHLLLLTSDCIWLQVDILNVRNREDLTQLRPTVTFQQTGKDLIYREFSAMSLRHAEERVLELSLE
jgi:Na+-translocating ferredoxin:NAD+ oxidoreductase RnfA subunit